MPQIITADGLARLRKGLGMTDAPWQWRFVEATGRPALADEGFVVGMNQGAERGRSITASLMLQSAA
ncbi:MAG: hypothetical protein DCF29_04930 [Alphaproteobacteria bacterium]|jgi:hypothetical protein|nr:MAG: hypothetical protein DCF29_04930 [Alphaproteobacteria bacterium]